MSFRVDWRPDARDCLAEIWIDATDKRAVADASDKIDQMLRDDPEGVGESRAGNARILIVRPRAVDYRVYLDGRLVNDCRLALR